MALSPGPGLTLIDSKDITFGKILGEGGFGAVYKARHVNWGDVAVKRLKGVTFNIEVQKEADRMLRVVSSPYLVTVMGLMKNPGDVGIVMEYFDNGSLKKFEKKFMKCDCWARKVKMVQDIAFGMNYLHTLKPPIIHRDLKLENVFVGSGLEAKIGDLGLAVSSKSSLQKAHVSGTRSHIPPEASSSTDIEPDEFWDIYTFAITTYELTSGTDAWPQQQKFANDALIGLWVLKGHRPKLEVIPPEAPSELIDIITRCWVEEPKQRPCFKEILDSITELFESRYQRLLRKADRAISEQMDLEETHEAREPQTGAVPDSGVGSDVWQSLEAMTVEDKAMTSDSGVFSDVSRTSLEAMNVKDKTMTAATEESSNIKWNYKHTIDASGRIEACHMISRTHLAVCMKGCVKVYEVSAESSHLAYTITSQEWKEKDIRGVAVSDSLQDSMLVICEYKPYVYQYPSFESTKELKRYKIQSGDPWYIVANASVAVIKMCGQSSFIICSLPDFTQSHVQMDFSPDDLSINSDYLLVMGWKEMVVKSLDDTSQDVCRINPPDGYEYKSVTFGDNGSEIYAACVNGGEGCVYKYTRDVGKPEYINSGRIIDGLLGIGFKRLSVASDRILAVEQSKKVKIYELQ
ncbi:uncharacterized protein [Amphiura filiformis]|uniref:uncharacterized protein n=1 Tax=Amphiura filiformis TaxID=82378 RepID=UPI003B218367